MKILSYMYLWTGKFTLNLGSHRGPESGSGFDPDVCTLRELLFPIMYVPQTTAVMLSYVCIIQSLIGVMPIKCLTGARPRAAHRRANASSAAERRESLAPIAKPQTCDCGSFRIEPSIGIASAGKVHFRTMFSMILSFEPMILKMSPRSCGPGNEFH